MRFDRIEKGIVAIFALCGVLIVSGYFYLDTRLARLVLDLIGTRFLFSSEISKIPDILLSLVCSLTCISWSARIYLARKPGGGSNLEFLEYIGSALPVAFVFETGLKDLFGRTNLRVWLLHPGPLGFHWFHGGGDFSGFPSGHMAVFTVLMIGIGRYFPRFRPLCAAMLLLLALALIITGYHFLSDIAAGVLVGLAVALLIRAAIPFLHRLADRCPRRFETT